MVISMPGWKYDASASQACTQVAAGRKNDVGVINDRICIPNHPSSAELSCDADLHVLANLAQPPLARPRDGLQPCNNARARIFIQGKAAELQVEFGDLAAFRDDGISGARWSHRHS